MKSYEIYLKKTGEFLVFIKFDKRLEKQMKKLFKDKRLIVKEV